MRMSRTFRFLVLGITLIGGVQLGATDPKAPAGARSPGTRSPGAAVPPKKENIAQLQKLVEAAENALEQEDFDLALSSLDEAETLVEVWPDSVLKRSDVSPWIGRLQVLQRQLEIEEITDEGEGDILIPTDEFTVSPSELNAEREYVLKAEEGAFFDFPIDLNEKVLSMVKYFTGPIKTKIETSLSRGSSYLPMIRQVFEEEGIPQDLCFLPLIESGYINKIKSKAKAAGMWQFIPSTGRMFGLRQNRYVDETRDPVKSTQAAARYLKQLYRGCGDWYLALAGYNNGPGRVESAADKINSRNFWDIARSPYMRNETKHYVPGFCAAVLVGRFPERYGLTVTQEKPFAYEWVDVDRATPLKTLAAHAGVELEELKLLNPELLRDTTPPGAWRIKVPPGKGAITARNLDQAPDKGRPARAEAEEAPEAEVEPLPSIPGGKKAAKPARAKKLMHTVKKGETLSAIARRYDVDIKDLKALNGLKKNTVQKNQKLKIPKS